MDRRVRLRSIQMKAAIEKSSSINRNGTLSRSSLLNEFPSKLTYRLLLHFQLARIVIAVIYTHIYIHIYIVYVQFIGISHIREYIIYYVYLLYLLKNDVMFWWIYFIDNSIDIVEIVYRILYIKIKILHCNEDLFLFYLLLQL